MAAIYKTKRGPPNTFASPTLLGASELNPNQTQFQVSGQQQTRQPRVNLNEVTVLPRAEWERIKDQLSDEPMAEKIMKAKLAEREKLAEESKKLVSTWTNTIAGQRAKKLQAKKIREEKEEVERQAIDIEEAKYQAEQRKEILEEAKKLQYWKTDRVKNLHSALTLTEVLRERDEQLKLQKRLKSAQMGADAKWAAKEEAENLAALEKDKKDALERHQKSIENRGYLVKQVKDRNMEKDREKLRDKLEGIEIQDGLRQYNEELLRIDQVKADEKRQLLRAHEETLANKTLLEAIERQNEDEKDERIRRFALAKREMAKLRAQREREMLDERLRIRDEQTEKLGNVLRQQKSQEQDRLLNALKEKEEKDSKDELEKIKAQQEMFASINEHRIETEKLRREREKKERLEAIEMRHSRLMADELFQEHETKKAKERFDHEKALKQIHLAQTTEKRDKETKLKTEELQNDFKNVELLRLEAEQFQKYAQEVINEEKDRGAKNLYPLVKVANSGIGGGHGPLFESDGNLRPSYQTSDQSGKEMPNYQAPGAVDTKKGQCNNTAKRLGFVWKG